LQVFFHVDDFHLYYNMSSLIWKGRQLEPHFGTKKFVFLGFLLAILSNAILVGTSFIMAQLLQYEAPMYSCAVGFSAVLFGLKVIITDMSPDSPSNVMGLFDVSSKYVYWVELLLIQILVPRASFLGHLCGILAGLLYTKGYLAPLFVVLNYIPDFVPNQPTRNENQDQSTWQPASRRRIVNGVLYSN